MGSKSADVADLELFFFFFLLLSSSSFFCRKTDADVSFYGRVSSGLVWAWLSSHPFMVVPLSSIQNSQLLPVELDHSVVLVLTSTASEPTGPSVIFPLGSLAAPVAICELTEPCDFVFTATPENVKQQSSIFP